jgi:hypothetical protein
MEKREAQRASLFLLLVWFCAKISARMKPLPSAAKAESVQSFYVRPEGRTLQTAAVMYGPKGRTL